MIGFNGLFMAQLAEVCSELMELRMLIIEKVVDVDATVFFSVILIDHVFFVTTIVLCVQLPIRSLNL